MTMIYISVAIEIENKRERGKQHLKMWCEQSTDYFFILLLLFRVRYFSCFINNNIFIVKLLWLAFSVVVVVVVFSYENALCMYLHVRLFTCVSFAITKLLKGNKFLTQIWIVLKKKKKKKNNVAYNFFIILNFPSLSLLEW